MFARNVPLSATTIQKLMRHESTRARRKMALSDAIRCGSGEAARRGVDNSIAARGVGRWPSQGVCVDWQLEEPRVG
jgi:hypothetical protein